jgi:hypothetical protein
MILKQGVKKRMSRSEKQQQQHKAFCSLFEIRIAEALTKAKVVHEYEAQQFHYLLPDSKIKHSYTPDWSFPGTSMVLEAKGYWFKKKERDKYRMVKKQNPDMDLRFVFQDASLRLHKDSNSTYADWARRYGFRYSEGVVPDEWIEEIREQQEQRDALAC